jgi:hypothetical protein
MAKRTKSSDQNNNNQSGKIEMVITNQDKIKRLGGKDLQKNADLINNNIAVEDIKVKTNQDEIKRRMRKEVQKKPI